MSGSVDCLRLREMTVFSLLKTPLTGVTPRGGDKILIISPPIESLPFFFLLVLLLCTGELTIV